MSFTLDRHWRRLALAATTLQSPCTVLDIACGTGDFTAEVRRRHPAAEITGLDLTPEMLNIARSKFIADSNVHFMVGNAQNLKDIKDSTFDMVVCAFGFRNFPDKAKSLAECRRVLKPSGELVVLELFRPTSRILGTLVNAWLAAVAFLFARGAHAEYAYLRHSMAHTVTADEFTTLAESSGFKVLRRRFLFPAATCLTMQSSDRSVSLPSNVRSAPWEAP